MQRDFHHGLLGPRPRSARAVARGLGRADGLLDRDRVDEALVRSHLELQRLHEDGVDCNRVLVLV